MSSPVSSPPWRRPEVSSTFSRRQKRSIVHTVVECAKLAFADREAWYGDPDFVDVPMRTLLGAAYNDARRRLVAEHASMDLRPGSPDGRVPRVLVSGLEMAGAGIGEPTAG